MWILTTSCSNHTSKRQPPQPEKLLVFFHTEEVPVTPLNTDGVLWKAESSLVQDSLQTSLWKLSLSFSFLKHSVSLRKFSGCCLSSWDPTTWFSAWIQVRDLQSLLLAMFDSIIHGEKPLQCSVVQYPMHQHLLYLTANWTSFSTCVTE